MEMEYFASIKMALLRNAYTELFLDGNAIAPGRVKYEMFPPPGFKDVEMVYQDLDGDGDLDSRLIIYDGGKQVECIAFKDYYGYSVVCIEETDPVDWENF